MAYREQTIRKGFVAKRGSNPTHILKPAAVVPPRLASRATSVTMRDHLEACGFPYLCTDSVDEAIDWLKARGILRGGFTVQ